MKRIPFFALLLAASLALSSCSMLTVNPERDGAQIVATVNGENITKKQVYDAAGFTWEDKVEDYQKDDRQTAKEQALETLIGQKVILQKAKDEGFYNFTEDEKKKINDNVTSYTQSIYDSSLSKYQDQAKTDSSIKPEELAQKDVDDYLASIGYTHDKLVQEEQDNTAYNKLKDSITSTVNPTDEDIQTGYNDKLAAQKTSYDASPSQLITDDLNGETILYYPNADFVRVRHILIKIPDDVYQQISQLRTDGKDTEADSMRDTALKAIAAKANEALAKAKAPGADLEALIKEYGEDPGMTSRTDGYPIYKDYTGYVKGFTEAALTLTELNVPSDLVPTDFGYHIMWLTEKPAQGAVPFDQVKDAMKTAVTTDKQNEAWSTQVNDWITALEADKKITKNVGRLRD